MDTTDASLTLDPNGSTQEWHQTEPGPVLVLGPSHETFLLRIVFPGAGNQT